MPTVPIPTLNSITNNGNGSVTLNFETLYPVEVYYRKRKEFTTTQSTAESELQYIDVRGSISPDATGKYYLQDGDKWSYPYYKCEDKEFYIAMNSVNSYWRITAQPDVEEDNHWGGNSPVGVFSPYNGDVSGDASAYGVYNHTITGLSENEIYEFYIHCVWDAMSMIYYSEKVITSFLVLNAGQDDFYKLLAAIIADIQALSIDTEPVFKLVGSFVDHDVLTMPTPCCCVWPYEDLDTPQGITSLSAWNEYQFEIALAIKGDKGNDVLRRALLYRGVLKRFFMNPVNTADYSNVVSGFNSLSIESRGVEVTDRTANGVFFFSTGLTIKIKCQNNFA